MTVEFQPAMSNASSVESSGIGSLLPEEDDSSSPVGAFNDSIKPAAGVSFLVLSQFFILVAFFVMGVLFWFANSWILPLYESLHLYLFWPLGCCALMVFSVGVVCCGVGRHGVDPVRGRVGRVFLSILFIVDLALFYFVLLRTFSLAWSFLNRNSYFLVWGSVWTAICSLLLLAVPVILHLPIFRIGVNVWANSRIGKWLAGDVEKDSKKHGPDGETKFDDVDRYASTALIRHCERKTRAWFFRRPSDHLLRVLQCDANNSAAHYEHWWTVTKWVHFRHIFIPETPILQKTESKDFLETGSTLETLLNDLLRSQSNLMLYSCLFKKWPPRVRIHIYAEPLFVSVVNMHLAFEQLIRLEILDFWAGELRVKLASLDNRESRDDISQDKMAEGKARRLEVQNRLNTVESAFSIMEAIRPWAINIIDKYAHSFSLEGPFREYIDQLVKWLTDGGLDNPDVEFLVRDGKSIIADAFPWPALYERTHDENTGSVGKTLLEGHFCPYVLYRQVRMHGRKSLNEIRAVAPIMALRVAVQGAYSLWLARLAVKSPALAVKVYREVAQDLRQDGGLDKLVFLCGTRAHRIYGDALMFYSTRKRRFKNEMHSFVPILMDDAEDAYAMAGMPEDMKNVRELTNAMRNA